MAIYNTLPKLGRVSLPPVHAGDDPAVYALIDVDGRAIIAPNFRTDLSYEIGDHVIYKDNLYRFNTAHPAGGWPEDDPATQTDERLAALLEYAERVTLDSEIKRIEGILAGGIHYRGKTTTPLYDGAETNPITINNVSYIAESGDLVLMQLSTVAQNYTVGIAIPVNTYIKNDGKYYISIANITAAANTDFDAIKGSIDQLNNDPEFLFDGQTWAVLGSVADGLGDLAFKDEASGTYRKPTGTGTVTIKNITKETKKLSTTTIVGTNGTVRASEVTDGVDKDQWKQNGTINFGQADVGAETTVGDALTGTTTFNTDAIKDATLTGTTTFLTGAIKAAELTGTKTFNTDAIKAAALTGTKTFVTEGVVAEVEDDCLTFSFSSTGTVGIDTTPASTGTVGISTTPADQTGTVGIDTTPASTGTVGLNTKQITPATQCPVSRTAVNLIADGTLRGSYTITPRTPAVVASSSTTVATGQLEEGSQLVSSVTQGTETASVTVGIEDAVVTVK